MNPTRYISNVAISGPPTIEVALPSYKALKMCTKL